MWKTPSLRQSMQWACSCLHPIYIHSSERCQGGEPCYWFHDTSLYISVSPPNNTLWASGGQGIHNIPYYSLTVHWNLKSFSTGKRGASPHKKFLLFHTWYALLQQWLTAPSTRPNQSIPKCWMASPAGLSILLGSERKWGQGQSRKKRSMVANFLSGGIKVRCLDPHREPINSPCILKAKRKSSARFIPSFITTIWHFLVSRWFRDIPDFLESLFVFVLKGEAENWGGGGGKRTKR